MRKYSYVYLIRAYRWHKIGRTRDITARLLTLKTLPPFELELLHLIECDDSVTPERLLHQHFKDKRVRGEWFLLEDDDVTYFMSFHHFFRGRFYDTTDSESYAAYSLGSNAARNFKTPAMNLFVPGTPGHNGWWEGYCDQIVTGPDLWCPAHELRRRIGANVIDRVLRERGLLDDAAFCLGE